MRGRKGGMTSDSQADAQEEWAGKLWVANRTTIGWECGRVTTYISNRVELEGNV